MSIHVVKPETLSYAVDDTSNVTVSIVIGNAQGGGWSIDLDGTRLAKGSGTNPIVVGAGSAIRGKELQVVASVLDINPATTRLNAIVTVDGGSAGKKSIPQTYDNGSSGDLAVFTTLVDFA